MKSLPTILMVFKTVICVYHFTVSGNTVLVFEAEKRARSPGAGGEPGS